MTDTPHGPPDDAAPAGPVVDADEHLRRTSSKIIFGAAGVAAIVGVVGIVNGTAGAGSLMALLLAGILSWLGYRRAGGGLGSPKSQNLPSEPGSVTVTDEDVAKARSLTGEDLSIEDICRLTRGGYSWWTEADKTRFRNELNRRLGE